MCVGQVVRLAWLGGLVIRSEDRITLGVCCAVGGGGHVRLMLGCQVVMGHWKLRFVMSTELLSRHYTPTGTLMLTRRLAWVYWVFYGYTRGLAGPLNNGKWIRIVNLLVIVTLGR